MKQTHNAPNSFRGFDHLRYPHEQTQLAPASARALHRRRERHELYSALPWMRRPRSVTTPPGTLSSAAFNPGCSPGRPGPTPRADDDTTDPAEPDARVLTPGRSSGDATPTGERRCDCGADGCPATACGGGRTTGGSSEDAERAGPLTAIALAQTCKTSCELSRRSPQCSQVPRPSRFSPISIDATRYVPPLTTEHDALYERRSVRGRPSTVTSTRSDRSTLSVSRTASAVCSLISTATFVPTCTCSYPVVVTVP